MNILEQYAEQFTGKQYYDYHTITMIIRIIDKMFIYKKILMKTSQFIR